MVVLHAAGFAPSLNALASEAQSAPPCSLLMADIDHFKRVNDTYGHVFGDMVIRCVAQRISLNIKRRDVAARYGGEEFAMPQSETKLQGAKVLAEQTRATTARVQRAVALFNY